MRIVTLSLHFKDTETVGGTQMAAEAVCRLISDDKRGNLNFNAEIPADVSQQVEKLLAPEIERAAKQLLAGDRPQFFDFHSPE